VCAWNVAFNTAVCEPALESRALFLDARSHKDTCALARELLKMDAGDCAAASKGSAIKRAKLWNGCVVPGNAGTNQDLAELEAMLVHEDAIVREHAAWAMARLETQRASS
jgi:epoxyqueuosine reductase